MLKVKENTRYKILTQEGFKNFDAIKQTKGFTTSIWFEDTKKPFVCSNSHMVQKDGEYISVENLCVGDTLEGKTITRIDVQETESELFDILAVQDTSSYITDGIVSHNCAFIPKNVWDDFFKSVLPTISSGEESKFMTVSTPNGMNHFYDMWSKAKEGKSEFVPFEVNWWDVPGRDKEWQRKQIMNSSEEDFAQEYGNSFGSTSKTLISSEILKRLEREIAVPLNTSKTLKIYREPEKFHNYVVSCDCADVGIDYSTCSVIDVSTTPYVQVAVFRDNNISHLNFPQIIVNLATKYNDASVLVESNDVGKTILHILNYELEYENIVRTKNSQGKSRLGQLTTSKTKAIGCARLKDIAESGNFIIYDEYTLKEARRFSLNDAGTSYSAESGYHDDMIMTLVNFSYFASTLGFRERYDTNFVDIALKNKIELEENELPIPIISGKEYEADTSWLHQ